MNDPISHGYVNEVQQEEAYYDDGSYGDQECHGHDGEEEVQGAASLN